MLRPRSQLQVEVLEDRSVPAVAVLGLNAGDLYITGDNQSNDIDITATPSGDIRIQANGLTTLLALVSVPTTWSYSYTPTLIILNPPIGANLDNLYINMGDGNDKVSIGSITINNNLVIRDSPGGNDIVAMNGTMVINDTYIHLTKGNDKVFLTNSQFNNLFISTAGGNDVVRFLPGGTVTVFSNLEIKTGGGNDRVFVDPSIPVTLQVFGTTSIQTGLGNDFVRFGAPSSTGSTVNLQGDTVIDTGAGNDRIYMRNAFMSLLVALLGDGNDKVDNNWGTDNVTVGSGSLLDGGNGTDILPPGWTPPANLTVINIP